MDGGGYRSKSYADGRMQPYTGAARPDFRSLSYAGGRASSSYQYQYGGGGGPATITAAAEEVNRSKSKRWLSLGDPDMERKRRVAAYKAYSVQGKMKGSFRNSFRWIKNRYLHLLYGSS